jgi:hypothetical protein
MGYGRRERGGEMNRRASASIAAVALATLASTLVSGCGKSTGGGGPAGVDRRALRVFPADSEILVGVSGPALRKSRHFEAIRSRLPAKAAAALDALRGCGVDVVGGLGSMMAAGKSQDEQGLIQVSGFRREQLAKCSGTAGVEVSDQGRLTAVTVAGRTQHLGWLDDDTFVSGPELPAAAISERLEAARGLDGNADLMALLSKVDTKAAVWAAFAPPGGKMAVPMVGELGGVYGSAWLDDGLRLVLGVRLPSTSAANRVVKLAKQGLPRAGEQLGELGRFVAKMTARADGRDVVFEIQLSDAELEALIEAARKDPRIQMMMGMLRR